MPQFNTIFLFLFSTIMVVSVFLIPFQNQIIFALLFTFITFLAGIFILFIFNLEFIPLLILLVIVGAVLILLVFAIFITNQQSNKMVNLLNNKWYSFIYLLLCCKVILFTSNLKITSFFQIWFYKYCGELEAVRPLYDLADQNGYAPALLVISFLLLLLTVGISFLFSTKK